MKKVMILKPVGKYQPGEVEVDDAEAKVICDGVKAMDMEEFKKKDAAAKDPKNLKLDEMNAMGIKNVQGPDQAKHDLEVHLRAYKAAAIGKPLASEDVLTVTGGVTPPQIVHPAIAKAQGLEVEDAADLKEEKKKLDEKKPQEKKK